MSDAVILYMFGKSLQEIATPYSNPDWGSDVVIRNEKMFRYKGEIATLHCVSLAKTLSRGAIPILIGSVTW